MQPAPVPGLRLDKWLFQARLFKTRALAAERIEKGGIRINGQPCGKPGRLVRTGDELVISAYGQLRVLRVAALGARRGPAEEARLLYHEEPGPVPDLERGGLIDPGGGTR